MAEKKSLVVTGPLVVAHMQDGTLRHLYQGAEVPQDQIDADQLKSLQEEGLVGSPDDDSKSVEK